MLERLPNELLLNIIEFCDLDSFYNLLAVSKQINFFCMHWRNLIAKKMLLKEGIYPANIPLHGKYSAYDSLKSYRRCLRNYDFSYEYLDLDSYTHYIYTHTRHEIYIYNLNLAYISEVKKK